MVFHSHFMVMEFRFRGICDSTTSLPFLLDVLGCTMNVLIYASQFFQRHWWYIVIRSVSYDYDW